MWWIIPLIFLIFAAIPLGVYCFPIHCIAQYAQGEAKAWLWIGFIKYQLYPEKKKEKKSTPKKTAEKSPEEKEEETLEEFFDRIKGLLRVLNELRQRVTVKKLEFKLILAGGDPAQLAINYGRAWAALGNLMPHLERLLTIKKRDLEVECDFTAPKTTLYAYADLWIPLGKAVYVLYQYMKIKEKVVQSNE